MTRLFLSGEIDNSVARCVSNGGWKIEGWMDGRQERFSVDRSGQSRIEGA